MKEISVIVENPFLRPLRLALNSSTEESEDFAVVNCFGWSWCVSILRAAGRSCVGIGGTAACWSRLRGGADGELRAGCWPQLSCCSLTSAHLPVVINFQDKITCSVGVNPNYFQ